MYSWLSGKVSSRAAPGPGSDAGVNVFNSFLWGNFETVRAGDQTGYQTVEYQISESLSTVPIGVFSTSELIISLR
jgi:hypothetical protein